MNALSLKANLKSSIQSYIELTKPKVVALIVFTAIVGMILAADSNTKIVLFFYACLGIALAAASAASLNHIFDRQIDATMRRTHLRPIPSGLATYKALIFAFSLALLSFVILIFLVNPITAILTFIGLIAYAFIYTLYLKHATPQNIVIGGFSGAIPPVLGYSAISGVISAESLLLFLIIFVWTPPHFWALAIARKEEYQKAKVPMLPVTHGIEFTKLQIVLYGILLVIVSLLPFATKMSGLIYLLSAIVLNSWYFYTIVLLYKYQQHKIYQKCFNCSIYYLSLLFASLIVDKFIPIYI